MPLAMHCADEGCNCSEGWEPIYNVSGDGVTVTMQCVVECALGEYAVIDEQSFAKVCSPPFSKKRQTDAYCGGTTGSLRGVPHQHVLVQQANSADRRSGAAVHTVPAEFGDGWPRQDVGAGLQVHVSGILTPSVGCIASESSHARAAGEG